MPTGSNPLHLAVHASDPTLAARAVRLARQLDLPLAAVCAHYRYCLTLTPARLEIRHRDVFTVGPVYIDFAAPALAYRRRHGGGRQQAIAKAVGVRTAASAPSVVDVTAAVWAVMLSSSPASVAGC
ncbi:MAG: class I SAM-dependent methyltransferase [Gammaproteobacteria bacterium]